LQQTAFAAQPKTARDGQVPTFGFGVAVGLLYGVLLALFVAGNTSPDLSGLNTLVRTFGSSTASEPTIRYFDGRGRAEALRLAFADRGVKFSDDTFTADQWGKDTVKHPDGLKAKLLGEGKLAFGQVPLVEVDGVALVQSHAILRYFARRDGWYASLSNAAMARVDIAADGTEDVRKQLTGIKYNGDLGEEDKKARYTAWFTEADQGTPVGVPVGIHSLVGKGWLVQAGTGYCT
jgi:hypothetical protein